MRRSLPLLLLPVLLSSVAPARATGGELRRFAVVVGAVVAQPAASRLQPETRHQKPETRRLNPNTPRP